MRKIYGRSARNALSLLLILALLAALSIPLASAVPDDDIDVAVAETIVAVSETGAPEADAPEIADADAEDEPIFSVAEISGPVADITTPAQGHYHNAAYAATPAGFRPDLVPAEVKLTGPENAAIFYNKAVITVSGGAAPSQALINAVADPTALSTPYTGPIPLAEISETQAVVIKAFSFTTAGGVESSPVATFVYWQRLWVLSDVNDKPENWPGDQESWDDYVIKLVIDEMTVNDKAQLMSGGQGATGDRLSTASIGRTAPIHRLCIPATQYTDGPAGVRDNRISTPFPVAVSISSSWDLDIMALFTSRVASEALYASYDIMLAQGVNTHRSPLGGRNFEYFSEDPILAGRFSVAYSKGLHKYGVGESVKHYVANEQETNRSGGNVVVDERCIREILMLPWEMAVKEADPFTVMSSYNCMNGPYVNQNPWAQEQVLRNEWGFKGYVMTDWGANYNDNCFESGNEVRQSGSAVTNVTNYLNATNVTAAERERRVERINLNCFRILKTNIRTAVFNCMFDDLTQAEVTRRRSGTAFYTDEASPYIESKAAAQAISEAGMVLLQNNNTLPLARDANIALVYDTVGTGTDNQVAHDYVVQGGGSGNITYNKAYVPSVGDSLKAAGFGLPYYVINTTAGSNAANAATQAAQAVAVADVGIMIVFHMTPVISDVAVSGFELN